MRELNMNVYTAFFTGLCPNDPTLVDQYKVKIHSKDMIMVEDIQSYLNSFHDKEVYQEALAKIIFDKFECNKVVLIGTHRGIRIKSTVK